MAFKNLLTTVDGQEEGSIDAVVDERGLTVQHGGGVHSPVDGVNVQPACWILVDRIPEKVPNKHRITFQTDSRRFHSAGTRSCAECPIILILTQIQKYHYRYKVHSESNGSA